MKKLQVLGFAILLPFWFTVLSCGRAPTGGGLVGTWISMDGQERIEFTTDGKFNGVLKYGMYQSLEQVHGSYFVDGAKLSMTPNGGYPMTWEFKVSGGEVVFNYIQGGEVKIDGSMAKFKRQ